MICLTLIVKSVQFVKWGESHTKKIEISLNFVQLFASKVFSWKWERESEREKLNFSLEKEKRNSEITIFPVGTQKPKMFDVSNENESKMILRFGYWPFDLQRNNQSSTHIAGSRMLSIFVQKKKIEIFVGL